MVLSLALIPCEQVRRGFSLIVQRACNSALLQSFFFYFAKTYIGLTEIETQMGVQAFQPQMEIQQRPSIESTISDNSRIAVHFIFIFSNFSIFKMIMPRACLQIHFNWHRPHQQIHTNNASHRNQHRHFQIYHWCYHGNYQLCASHYTTLIFGIAMKPHFRDFTKQIMQWKRATCNTKFVFNLHIFINKYNF